MSAVGGRVYLDSASLLRAQQTDDVPDTLGGTLNLHIHGGLHHLWTSLLQGSLDSTGHGTLDGSTRDVLYRRTTQTQTHTISGKWQTTASAIVK